MSAPRLCIDLKKIQHNARVLVQRLGLRGIEVTGVTKATLGCARIARAMQLGGVTSVGDSRLANIRRLGRDTRQGAENSGAVDQTEDSGLPLWLLRSPMLSETAAVVSLATISSNTELDVLDALSTSAVSQFRHHKVVLMIELGDLREGIPPGELSVFIARMLRLPGIEFEGIGTNLACLSGVIPDGRNMAELSAIALAVEREFSMRLRIVSGGNSANLNWAAGLGDSNRSLPGHINNLRLGEAILLGREACDRQPVPGLHTDAFSIVAEVIESKCKARQPRGTIGQMAIDGQPIVLEPDPAGSDLRDRPCRANRFQSILALGAQDVDPAGVTPPEGIHVLGASSDHLVIDTGGMLMRIGSEVSFQPNYSALLRAMTSPFVRREVLASSVPAPLLA